ncbi:MAG: hypothetical protein ACLQFR_29305 [Streptosporangiaceae bacterium]
MKRHASADELADLAAGVLKPRKVSKITAHLTSCAHCTDVSSQLASVSSMLASVPAAPMPPQLSGRIEAALAAEAAQRLASTPATEAGRRDLPSRGALPKAGGRGWWMFRPSGPGTRLVAAAGALVIIGAGSYEIVSHVSTGSSPSTAFSPSGVEVAPARLGTAIPYHQGRTTKVLQMVTSDTNFTGRTLGSKAVAAMTALRRSGVAPTPGKVVTRAPASPQATGLGYHGTASASNGTVAGSNGAPSKRQVTGCVDEIAAGRAVLLIELARFDGRPAIIIMIAVPKASSADVWAVRRTCTAANAQVLDRVQVART